MSTITIAEVLSALAQATAPVEGEDIPPNTYSGTEIREAMKWGHTRLNRELRKWIAAGEARVVTVRKYAVDGRLATTRAYQFAAPVAAKKAKR